MATDCVAHGSLLADSGLRPYRKTPTSRRSAATLALVCEPSEVRVTVTRTIDRRVRFLKSGRRHVAPPGHGELGNARPATTVPITIADCEFSQDCSRNGTTDITFYLDDPSPAGCSSVPAGSAASPTRRRCDRLTVSRRERRRRGGTGASDHAGQCITNTICNDPTVWLHGRVRSRSTTPLQRRTPRNGTATRIVGFAMFRVTGYSFNGSSWTTPGL